MEAIKVEVEKSSFVLEMTGRSIKDIAMAINDYLMSRGKIVDNKLVVRNEDIDKNLEKILRDLMKIWNFN